MSRAILLLTTKLLRQLVETKVPRVSAAAARWLPLRARGCRQFCEPSQHRRACSALARPFG